VEKVLQERIEGGGRAWMWGIKGTEKGEKEKGRLRETDDLDRKNVKHMQEKRRKG
jgi:hypothetical protein